MVSWVTQIYWAFLDPLWCTVLSETFVVAINNIGILLLSTWFYRQHAWGSQALSDAVTARIHICSASASLLGHVHTMAGLGNWGSVTNYYHQSKTEGWKATHNKGGSLHVCTLSILLMPNYSRCFRNVGYHQQFQVRDLTNTGSGWKNHCLLLVFIQNKCTYVCIYSIWRNWRLILDRWKIKCSQYNNGKCITWLKSYLRLKGVT